MHRLHFGPCRRLLTVACCLFVSFMATRAAIANGTTSSSTSPANNPDNNENMELVQLGSLPYWDAAVARQYSKNSNSSSSTSLSGGPAQHNNGGILLHVDADDNGNENGAGAAGAAEPISVCHVVALNRYAIRTYERETPTNRTYVESSPREMAAFALALEHLNTGNGAVVKEVEGLHQRCPVRFTFESLDSAGLAETSAEQVLDVLDRPGQPQQPRPCAFMGSRKSSVSEPTALLTSLRGLAQMSPLSLSDRLNDRSLFPLFGRVRPGSAAGAAPLVDFLVDELHLTHVAVVHTTDSFGLSFVDALRNAVAMKTVETESDTSTEVDAETEIESETDPKATGGSEAKAPVLTIQTIGYAAISGVGKPTDFSSTILDLKRTEYRYVVGVIHGYHYPAFTAEAHRQGLAGPSSGYNWIFATLFSNILTGDDPAIVKNQYSMSEETYDAMMQASVGVLEFFSVGGLPGVAGYDQLIEEYSKLIPSQTNDNGSGTLYLQSKAPSYPAGEPPFGLNFSDPATLDLARETDPGRLAFFYDTAVSLGLGVCDAYRNAANEAYAATADRNRSISSSTYVVVDGRRHYESIMNTTYMGASGNVRFNPATGSRESSSALFTITNFPLHSYKNQSNSSLPVLALKAVKTHYYYDSLWHEAANATPITFSDGSTTLPAGLPPTELKTAYIGAGLRAVGLTLAAVVLCLALACSSWTYRNRKDPVVRASQPLFLQILAAGTIFIGASIIPLSFDDEVVGPSVARAACLAFPWLFSIGWCTAFSALFVKTRRVVRIFNQPQRFRKVTVQPHEVLMPMVCMLGVNMILLTAWTALSRHDTIWVRTYMNPDTFGRLTESRGRCDFSQHAGFMLALIIINLGSLVLLLQQAWVARKISLQFAESEWIAKALTVEFIATFIGLPVLVLAYDDPQVFYFVLTAMIFTMSISLLGCIFLPKELYRRKRAIRPDGTNSGDVSEIFTLHNTSNQLYQQSQFSGALVIDHPHMRKELREEVTKLRRELIEKDTEIKRLRDVADCWDTDVDVEKNGDESPSNGTTFLPEQMRVSISSQLSMIESENELEIPEPAATNDSVIGREARDH